MSATAFQPEPSAKAPCTRTTFLIFVIVNLLSSFGVPRIVYKALSTKWIVAGTARRPIEDMDHFCGFLLLMRRRLYSFEGEDGCSRISTNIRRCECSRRHLPGVAPTTFANVRVRAA